MKVLERKEILAVLIEWGIHESRGRAESKLSNEDKALLTGTWKDFNSLQFILSTRRNLIALILQANPFECWQVEVSPEDISMLRVLGQPSSRLEDAARNYPQQDSAWIQRLADSNAEISGPLIAIGRQPVGRLTFFDGVHRVIAWAKHANRSLPYPIKVDVIATQRQVEGWE